MLHLQVGRLVTERLVLDLIQTHHAEALLTYYQHNALRFKPWEPEMSSDAFTLPYWRAWSAGCNEDYEAGRAVRFLAFEKEDESRVAIVASVNVTNIVLGPFQAAFLGYSLHAEHEGQGLALEAVSAVLGCAFKDLGLHRIMAPYQPENERSGRLLKRLGFVAEGYARDYLFLNGEWRDHVLTSLINPEYVSH